MRAKKQSDKKVAISSKMSAKKSKIPSLVIAIGVGKPKKGMKKQKELSKLK